MPVAQLDRAFPSEGKGRAFESHQAQIKTSLMGGFYLLLISDENGDCVRADFRTDDTSISELVRIANGMSRLGRKHKRRNSVSVEEIQDNRLRPSSLFT